MAYPENQPVNPSPPKKRGRPPISAQKPVEPEPVKPPSNDGVLEIKVDMPGHKTVMKTIRIKNILGNTTGSQRSPDGFMELLKSALRRSFPGVQ
jgi:hypothetical protein